MPRFVIQEHFAKQHHFDFRLELDGVLKSWAVPKGVPTIPGEKRLGVMVDDHPLEYINFEGEITKGNYGAGVVKIWDSGNFEIESRKDKKIVFFLYGKKLKGRYTILNFKDKNWLIFKTKEEHKIEKKEKKKTLEELEDIGEVEDPEKSDIVVHEKYAKEKKEKK